MTAIQPFGFYVLRRHLLPVDGLFALNETCQSTETSEAFLRQLFSSPTMQETLYIASPALYKRFQSWINCENITEKAKLIQTLFKYYLRICSRCTPYGMFAGCTTGEFGNETNIVFDESNSYRKFSRLDTNYIVEIVNFLLSDENTRNQLRFSPNNTIYKVGDKFHYLFYSIQDTKRSFAICSIDFSEYIKQILENAKNGCLIHDLVNTIANNEISIEEAYNFVQQLIEEQVLFSEIEPTITGDDFFTKMINKLSTININQDILDILHAINDLLQKPNLQAIQYEQIQQLLHTLVETPHQDFIQTDLFFNASENTIDKKIIEDLSKKFEKLLVLNHGNYSQTLDRFRQRFYERYEEAEIPLADALDNEIGVGYADLSLSAGVSTLIEDIKPTNETIQEVFWVYWKKFTLKKYTEALQNQDFEINLSDKDLDLLKEKHTEYRSSIPPNFFAFGSLFSNNDACNFYLKNLGGSSAVTILGRFGNGDEKLSERLKECIDDEKAKNEDVIFAEIVHLPEARIGNISTRPALRNFEIPYQTPASVATENQILIDDLMVSVKDGKQIILRSKKHNKRVIPRLSSAHNYQNGLNIYRFLGDLQFADDCVNVFWHWNLFTNQPFLPRVRYQNIVLSPAIWNLTFEDEHCFSKTEMSRSKLYEIQKKHKIPRYVTISEADNELFIDFENEMCLILFKDYISKNKAVTLKEVLFSPENCFLKTPQGNFNNEIVIPFRVTDYQPTKITLNRPKINLQRNFSVGSEWLYFKIYCGEKTAEELLKTCIKEIVEELLRDELIESFFFIRYQDPKPHLRLRFKGKPKSFFYTHIISSLNEALAPYQENGFVNEIMLDTYKREIERYGEKTILLSEKIFSNDSLSVIEFISTHPNDDERFSFALKRINAYLDAFGLDFQRKKNFAEMMQKRFLEEFGDEANLRKKLNDKYRNVSKEMSEIVSEEDSFDINYLANDIMALVSNNNQLLNLLSSYIHMFVNRLFISSSRTYELTLYHFLTKNYIALGHNKLVQWLNINEKIM